MIKKSVLAWALLTAGAGAQALPNLVLNGSFEQGRAVPVSPGYETYVAGDTGLNDWTIFSGTVDVVSGDFPALGAAQDGNNFLDLNGSSTGGLSQSFSVAANQQYQLSFWYALNGTNTGVRALVTVDPIGESLNSALLQFTSAPSQDPIGWKKYNATFTSTATSPVTLSFESLSGGAQGILLDNVSVSAVPEPGTTMLLLAGIGALGFVARRRKAI